MYRQTVRLNALQKRFLALELPLFQVGLIHGFLFCFLKYHMYK